MEFPKGGVEIAGGRLLEARELEITDPVLLVNDADLIDARHLDDAAADAQLPRRLALRGKAQHYDAAVGALQEVGGLIGRKLRGRLAINGQDSIAGSHAGLFGGTAGDHANDHQPAFLGLQFHAQPDKVPFDLRVHFVELIGREVGGIRIECVGGAAEAFEHDHRRRDAEPLLSQSGGRGHGVAGVIAVADGSGTDHPRQFIAEGLDRKPIGPRKVPLDEAGLAQRHNKVSGAVVHQVFPARKVDVMRFDFHQHLTVETQRPVGRHPHDHVAEASVGIAAFQVIVEPRGVEPLLQRSLLGMLPHGVFVVRQGLAPAALLLQLLTAAQQLGNLALGIRDGDRRGELSQGGGRQQQCDSRKASAEPNRMDPLLS